MLKYNLNKLFNSRGVINKPQFLIKNGFTRNVAYMIAGEKFSNLTLKHIEEFCFIFNCTPNDLLEWTPDKPEQANLEIPLKKLSPGGQYNLTKLINDVPFEKLGDFLKKMEEVKKTL